jgi:hypothetical protein
MTAVAKREASVPDMVRTPALSITAEDIALPRIYLGQFMSQAVQEGLVKAGQIFSATGADDPDPTILWSSDGKGEFKDGVPIYVLTIKKGKSWTAGPGEELQLFDYDDPAAPADAWVTYGYVVAIPALDDQVPFKLLLTRTGKPAALQINTVILKQAAAGPAWLTKFVLTTAPRENNKGKFFVPRVAVGEAVAAEVAIAETIGLALNSAAVERPQSGATEQPAI